MNRQSTIRDNRNPCADAPSVFGEKFQFYAVFGLFSSGLINIGYLCAVFWM